MRNTSLTAKQILKLADVKPSGSANRYLKRDLLKLATWCAVNLVLEQDDCPECGQAAPDECDWCSQCENPECQCVCEADTCDCDRGQQ